MQGKDMFVTEKTASAQGTAEKQARRYIQTLVKHIPGAIAWRVLRKHWGRAVTMAIWDPYFCGKLKMGRLKSN